MKKNEKMKKWKNEKIKKWKNKKMSEKSKVKKKKEKEKNNYAKKKKLKIEKKILIGNLHFSTSWWLIMNILRYKIL